jgi:hypothetical protein
MEEWRYRSTILDLGTRWRWVVSFTTRPLYPRGKSPRYPDRRLRGPQSRSGRGEEKIFPCPESNLGHPARSPPLYRASYPDSDSSGPLDDSKNIIFFFFFFYYYNSRITPMASSGFYEFHLLHGLPVSRLSLRLRQIALRLRQIAFFGTCPSSILFTYPGQ